MENTNFLVRGFTRFNVYLYSKPPSPVLKRINKAFLNLNIFLFRTSKGRIFGHFGQLDAMLLTTRGRRSRLERTVPVGFVFDRDRYTICAAPGHFDVPGGPQASQPGWYHNITADPHVRIDLGVERFDATARVLTGDERDRMWQRFTEVFPFIAEFQKRASHRIPIVELRADDLDPAEL